MFDSDEQSSQSKVRMSIAQKIGIFILVSVFGVFMGLIIYDNQLVEPAVFAAARIIIFVILIATIYLFIRKLVKKQKEAMTR